VRSGAALVLSAVMMLSGAVAGSAALAADERRSEPQDTIEVETYASTWASVAHDIASLTSYSDALTAQRREYGALEADLELQVAELRTQVATLADAVEQLRTRATALDARLTQARARQAAQERVVGALARLLYQQPSPELTAVAQLIEGEDLRSFDRQNLVTDVLESKAAELERITAEVGRLQEQLGAVRQELADTERDLSAMTERRDQAAAHLQRATDALRAIAADHARAQGQIDAIRRAEEARIRAAAAAAKAAEEAAAKAAASAVSGSAQPTGGGTPAHSSAAFSARLPGVIPYRDTFLTYGLRYRVEPALLAAIAHQESGFNAWAGCNRSGGGKGILQHEGESQYCGPGAVAASVEKAASMLAGYYNRSGSWTAAVFAYNNGPGLMDEWVSYNGNPDRLLAVVASYYDASPWATPGPRRGFSTWGQWRAAVAYSYAAPTPLPGYQSATQKWLIYRQG
jgi:peptidoglycan hydrolase CwlO-like protein